MTDKQFQLLSDILMEISKDLKAVRTDIHILTKYQVEDPSPQDIADFNRGFIKLLEDESKSLTIVNPDQERYKVTEMPPHRGPIPTCPTHDSVMVPGKWRFICPTPGCIQTAEFSQTQPKPTIDSNPKAFQP